MSEKLVAEERKGTEEEGSTTPILHRVIGSAVIIGLAVIVFSWLLGTPNRTVAPQVAEQQAEEDEEVFVSRIVPSEKVKKLVPNDENAQINIEASGVETADSINSIANSIPTPLKNKEEQGVDKATEIITEKTEPVRQLAAKEEPKAKPIATKEVAALKPKAEPAPAPAPKKDVSQQSFAEVSGWVVQIGAFSKLPGANARVDQLKENKILAKINKSTDNNKTIYRVFVGPFKNRAKAEDASKQIAQRVDMKPFVRKQ